MTSTIGCIGRFSTSVVTSKQTQPKNVGHFDRLFPKPRVFVQLHTIGCAANPLRCTSTSVVTEYDESIIHFDPPHAVLRVNSMVTSGSWSRPSNHARMIAKDFGCAIFGSSTLCPGVIGSKVSADDCTELSLSRRDTPPEERHDYR